MKNKGAGECRAIAQEHLEKIVFQWTCTLGARNRDKVLGELRKLILKHLKEQKGAKDDKVGSGNKARGKLAGQLSRLGKKT